MQIRASQTAGHTGHHQRADQTGAVANPDRQVRYPGGVQLAQHPRIGHQRIRQHDKVGGFGGGGGMRLAAVFDARARTAQGTGQQVRQRPPAMNSDRGRTGTPTRHRGDHARVDQRGHQVRDRRRVDAVGDALHLGKGRAGLQNAQQLTERGGGHPRRGADEHGAPGIPADLDHPVGSGQHRHGRIERITRHGPTLPRNASRPVSYPQANAPKGKSASLPYRYANEPRRFLIHQATSHTG